MNEPFYHSWHIELPPRDSPEGKAIEKEFRDAGWQTPYEHAEQVAEMFAASQDGKLTQLSVGAGVLQINYGPIAKPYEPPEGVQNR